jgi:hypothetical protein
MIVTILRPYAHRNREILRDLTQGRSFCELLENVWPRSTALMFFALEPV